MQNNNQIKITIEGNVMCGKTTIALLLENLLHGEGITNIKRISTDVGNEINDYINWREQKSARIASICNKNTSIIIEEKLSLEK